MLDKGTVATNSAIRYADDESRAAAIAYFDEIEKSTTAQIAQLQKELEDAKASVAQNKTITFGELPADVITAAQEQFVAENQLIESFCDSDPVKKVKFTTALNSCKSVGDRRKLIVTEVLREQHVNTESWTTDQVDAGFTCLLATSSALNAKPAPKAENKAVVAPSGDGNVFFTNPWAAARNRMLGLEEGK